MRGRFFVGPARMRQRECANANKNGRPMDARRMLAVEADQPGIRGAAAGARLFEATPVSVGSAEPCACATRFSVAGPIASVKVFGRTPMASTSTAIAPSSTNSRRPRSRRLDTRVFLTAPNITRLYIHSVYAALRISVSAAVAPTQKLKRIAPISTRNSPTKPDVPGKPTFAIENSIANVASLGIELATPP